MPYQMTKNALVPFKRENKNFVVHNWVQSVLIKLSDVTMRRFNTRKYRRGHFNP